MVIFERFNNEVIAKLSYKCKLHCVDVSLESRLYLYLNINVSHFIQRTVTSSETPTLINKILLRLFVIEVVCLYNNNIHIRIVNMCVIVLLYITSPVHICLITVNKHPEKVLCLINRNLIC